MNLKREFWENQRLLIITPILISGMMIVAAISTVIYANHGETPTKIRAAKSLPSDTASSDPSKIIDKITEPKSNSTESNNTKSDDTESDVTASGNPSDEVTETDFWYMGIYFAFSWVIVIFYLLSSLHSDRRDKSILFWKSMPVSDWELVVSKYLFASLAFAFFSMVIAWVNSIVLYSLVAMGINSEGVDANSTKQGFDFAQLFVWPLLVIGITWLWSSLWFSWALFCSARAKRFPILLFILAPLLYRVAEKLITGNTPLMNFLIDHSPWKLLSVMSKEPSLGEFFHYVFIENGSGIVASIIISGGLLYATTWYRVNRFEGE